MSVPPKDGLGLDDEQGIHTGLYPSVEQDEDTPVGSREARTFHQAVEDDELLTQQEVFGDQLRFTASEVNDDVERTAGNNRLGPA